MDELQLAGLINLCWKLGEPLRERVRALLGRMPGDEAHPLRPRPDTQ